MNYFLGKDRTRIGNYYSALLIIVRENILERRRIRVLKRVLLPLYTNSILPFKQFVITVQTTRTPSLFNRFSSDQLLHPSSTAKSLKMRKFSPNKEATQSVKAWFSEQDQIFVLKGLEALHVR